MDEDVDELVRAVEEPTEYVASVTRDAEAEVEDKEARKSKRKIYKGMVAAAGDLEKDLKGALPVQPMVRRVPGTGRGMIFPPTFVLTRFAPSWTPGRVLAHYYHPASGTVSYRDVPKEFELNILQGKRGAELAAEWDKAKGEKLHLLAHRLACTIGADPEIFAEKDGEVYPAWKYAGAKTRPHVYEGAQRGHVYWDGFQAEFDTPGDLTCLMQMSDAIQHGLKKLHQLVTAKKAKLTLQSVYPVNPDLLQKLDEKHVAFGCSPSFNVYGLKGNIASGREVPYRFAGGHIHFGLQPDEKTEKTLQGYVRALDTVLGVACVSLFGAFDNPIRRQFYGQPGEYRTPAHGLEYRVLSNAWLTHPMIFHMVFDMARAAVGLHKSGFMSSWAGDEKETVEVIMAHDVTRARAILKRNEGCFKGLLRMCGGAYMTNTDTAYRVWANGLEIAVKDPEDIPKNWHLEGHWNHNERMFHNYAGQVGNGKTV